MHSVSFTKLQSRKFRLWTQSLSIHLQLRRALFEGLLLEKVPKWFSKMVFHGSLSEVIYVALINIFTQNFGVSNSFKVRSDFIAEKPKCLTPSGQFAFRSELCNANIAISLNDGRCVTDQNFFPPNWMSTSIRLARNCERNAPQTTRCCLAVTQSTPRLV